MSDVPDLDVSYLTLMWKEESIELDGNVNRAEMIGLMVMGLAMLIREDGDGT